MNRKKPIQSWKILAKVVPRPEFVGTLHDNATAIDLGYPAALVPGIDIYAYLSQFGLRTWGQPWLERGALTLQAIRPVFDNQWLTVAVEASGYGDEEEKFDLHLYNSSDTLVAQGAICLRAVSPEIPSRADYSILRRGQTVPPGTADDLQVGMRFSSVSAVVSDSDNARHSREFTESTDFYVRTGYVHPAYLQRLALSNAHSSFAHPTPPIYIASTGQNFEPARVGETLDTPGIITRLWERNGHHYMRSTQLVLANESRVVMRIDRTTIYQARVNVHE